ncbi:MAG: hypothetical protein ACO2ZE_05030 [Pseudohongiellaceae bacterium]
MSWEISRPDTLPVWTEFFQQLPSMPEYGYTLPIDAFAADGAVVDSPHRPKTKR